MTSIHMKKIRINPDLQSRGDVNTPVKSKSAPWWLKQEPDDIFDKKMNAFLEKHQPISPGNTQKQKIDKLVEIFINAGCIRTNEGWPEIRKWQEVPSSHGLDPGIYREIKENYATYGAFRKELKKRGLLDPQFKTNLIRTEFGKNKGGYGKRSAPPKKSKDIFAPEHGDILDFFDDGETEDIVIASPASRRSMGMEGFKRCLDLIDPHKKGNLSPAKVLNLTGLDLEIDESAIQIFFYENFNECTLAINERNERIAALRDTLKGNSE